MRGDTIFRFWYSDKHGLIRQRTQRDASCFPEIWRDGKWVVGSSYVMDAITGMGEDSWSCGECADEWSEQQAKALARKNGIDLLAERSLS